MCCVSEADHVQGCFHFHASLPSIPRPNLGRRPIDKRPHKTPTKSGTRCRRLPWASCATSAPPPSTKEPLWVRVPNTPPRMLSRGSAGCQPQLDRHLRRGPWLWYRGILILICHTTGVEGIGVGRVAHKGESQRPRCRPSRKTCAPAQPKRRHATRSASRAPAEQRRRDRSEGTTPNTPRPHNRWPSASPPPPSPAFPIQPLRSQPHKESDRRIFSLAFAGPDNSQLW